jgi:dihydroorotate dehydrogenase (fumarate)
MDLTTRYLGFELEHPLVPSASPLTRELESLKKLEDAGASMVVLPSLFEEQIEHESKASEHFFNQGTESFSESLTYFPACQEHLDHGLDEYLELVRKAKENLSIPVVASLNGADEGGWLKSAKLIQEAGADALELNVYYVATDQQETSNQVEARLVDILKSVKSAVSLPIAMKLSPFFSSLANIAKQLDEAGVNSLVFFNRFYQPDIDIENLELYPHLVLSNSEDLRLPLRWISILCHQVKCDLAASSGIHTVEDAVKAVMAGARVTHLCSALLKQGPQHIEKLKTGLAAWLEEHEYDSLNQMTGSMCMANCPDSPVVERANYMQALYSWEPTSNKSDPGSGSF